MKKGNGYTFEEIEKYAHENDFSYNEIGYYAVGKYFVVLSQYEKGKTISFVLTGQNSKHSIYECVYTD